MSGDQVVWYYTSKTGMGMVSAVAVVKMERDANMWLIYLGGRVKEQR